MKPPRKNHPRRSRISSRLPTDLRHRLEEYSAAKGLYECEVLRAALEQYLDGTGDMTLLYRRLDAMNREQHRQRRALELHGELLKEFVQMMLKITAVRTDTESPEHLRRAARRYGTIIVRVKASLDEGKTWVDDLPKELLTPVVDPLESPREGAARTPSRDQHEEP